MKLQIVQIAFAPVGEDGDIDFMRYALLNDGSVWVEQGNRWAESESYIRLINKVNAEEEEFKKSEEIK